MSNEEKKEIEKDSKEIIIVNNKPLDVIVRPAVSATEALNAWNAYQELKAKIVTDDDKQKIEGKIFLKKSFWRKISTFFNLSVEIVSEQKEEYPDGDVAYHFVCKALAPNGRFSIGAGSCSIYEKAEKIEGEFRVPRKVWNDKFKKMVRVKDSNGEFLWEKAKQNSWHNTRSTAETRAFNRCVSNLVGGGEVSAEEVEQEYTKAGKREEESPADIKSEVEKQQKKNDPQTEKPAEKPAEKKEEMKKEFPGIGNKKMSKKERKEIFAELQPKTQIDLDGKEKILPICENCNIDVDNAVYAYSYNHLDKHILCRDCQQVFWDCLR